jgi:2-oxoglutarate/2-oxoacid ferredoxin oxidoreductase subunit beta
MVTLELYNQNTVKSQWCPGCGDFAVIKSLKEALVSLEIHPKDLVITAGIGCSGRAFAYLNGYSFHGVHGRALPLSSGIKLANEALKVLVLGGDGDGYAIGMGHFPHAIRRNLDLTYVVMNNQTYGLTKGQVSPTSDPGFRTSTTPAGNIEGSIDPMAIAMSSGITFLARGFSGNPKHLTKLFERALAHKGFSLVDVLSPCVTYNRVNTYDWYREHSYYLDEEPGYDPTDRKQAWDALLHSDKVPLGLIYQGNRPAYEDLRHTNSRQPIALQALQGIDYAEVMEEFF